MAKRFTDTQKYKKHFMRSLPGAYKLFWDFLYTDCDHSGIWIVDFEAAQMYLGKDMPVTHQKAIELFNSDQIRIVELDGGKKWFIPSFIEFQYGQLVEAARPHIPIIKALRAHGLLSFDLKIIIENKPFTNPLQRVKEQEKEKDKEQEKEKDSGSADFSDYEKWTDDAISGNDFLFSTMLKNESMNLNGQLSDLAKQHLGLLAQYPKKAPPDQHRFRRSLIEHIRKELKNEPAKRIPRTTVSFEGKKYS